MAYTFQLGARVSEISGWCYHGIVALLHVTLLYLSSWMEYQSKTSSIDVYSLLMEKNSQNIVLSQPLVSLMIVWVIPEGLLIFLAFKNFHLRDELWTFLVHCPELYVMFWKFMCILYFKSCTLISKVFAYRKQA